MSGTGRRTAVGAFLAVLVGVSGCAGGPSRNEPLEYRPGTVYQDPLGVFAIVVPDGWAVDPDHPYPPWQDDEDEFGSRDVAFVEQAVLDDPAADAEWAPAIQIDVDPWGGDLDEAVDGPGRSPTLGRPPAVDERLTLSDGTPAHLVGTREDNGDQTRTLYMVNGNTLVTGRVLGIAQQWDRYGSLYEAALRSVTAPVPAPAPTGSELNGHVALPGVAYRDDEGRFTVQPPPGWRIGVTADALAPERTSVTFVQSDPHDYLTTRSAITIGQALDADPYEPPGTLAEEVEVERGFPDGVEYHSEEQVLLADGTPAHLFEGTSHHDSGDGEVMVLIAVAHGELYRASAYADRAEDWERNRGAIQATLRSLTFS